MNNNREWFNEYRGGYEVTRIGFEDFLSPVTARTSLLDGGIHGTQPKDRIYRTYRNTCFSPDRTPHKNHFGGYINAKGRESNHNDCYVRIQPEDCMLAGGSLRLLPNVLKASCQPIYDNTDEYRPVVEGLGFERLFPVVGRDLLKTAPKGLPKDFKYTDYLKPKESTCVCSVLDSSFLAPDILDKTEEVSRQFKRFAGFTNFTIDDFE